MTICTQCGALMNDQDAASHKCDPAEIPAQGMIYKKGSATAVPIEEHIDDG